MSSRRWRATISCRCSRSCQPCSNPTDPSVQATTDEETPPLLLDESPASEAVGQGDVPDLDLARAFAELGSDASTDGPAPDLVGADRLLVCGTPVLDQGLPITGRLVATLSGPEFGQFHQVIAYQKADSAQAQMGHLRDLLDGCERQARATDDSGAPPMEIRWRHEDTATGYDTVSFGSGLVYVETGEIANPGSQTLQVTRVGRALLVVGESSEGNIDDFDQYVADLSSHTRDLAPELCSFTARGC